jgi:hypothetical protein
MKRRRHGAARQNSPARGSNTREIGQAPKMSDQAEHGTLVFLGL